MCFIFKKFAFVDCSLCRGRSAHELRRVVNCRKASYSCLLCGGNNGLRVPTAAPPVHWSEYISGL